MTALSNGDQPGPSTPVTLAYLGPPGTYGNKAAKIFQEALRSRLDAQDAQHIKLIPCQTITDVYNSSAAYSVLPIENTIHGAVLESLDCLLNPSTSAPRAQIIAETALSISHSLVGLRGTQLEEIQYVRSHEQALGQCSHWLETHCPRAKRGASDSTAGAAMDLLSDTDGTGGIGAAICSKDVVEQYPQLEVLAEGIQDRKLNSTRFWLLENSSSHLVTTSTTMIRLIRTADASVLGKLAALKVVVVSVHCRPAGIDPSSSEVFPRRYLVEVRVSDSESLQSVLDMEGVWDLGGWLA